MNQHISLTILIKNEQKNIDKNFNWLKDIKTISEIIVVNDFSSDNTIDIFKSKIGNHQKLKVYQRKLDNDFSSQRQYSVSKSSNFWTLWLDADEVPSPSMINFLNNFSPTSHIHAYSFIRHEVFLGYKLNYGQSKQKMVRLFNKNEGRFVGYVHELWKTADTKDTNIIFFHHSNQNITQILNKINFYTNIRALELLKNKITTNIFQVIFFPLAKFFQNYIFKLGFLDGTPGIILSLTMSLHSFLVRSKLWHLSNKSSST